MVSIKTSNVIPIPINGTKISVGPSLCPRVYEYRKINGIARTKDTASPIEQLLMRIITPRNPSLPYTKAKITMIITSITAKIAIKTESHKEKEKEFLFVVK